MLKSLLLGTIVGGLVAFLWSWVSWGVLPWHEKALLKFQNEAEVTAMITSHTIDSGMYLLPGKTPTNGLTGEQKKAAEAADMEKMQKQPIMLAAIRRNGFGSMAQGLVIQLLCQMAAAFLLTWLLLQTSGLSYARRVIFLAVAGLTASVIVDLPNWNWWGFSSAYTLVNLADFTLTWLLAGLAIAKVAKP
ncbi:MAG: hypothetical protein NVS9B13_21960 [Candidatus Acidiferrum sp.]